MIEEEKNQLKYLGYRLSGLGSVPINLDDQDSTVLSLVDNNIQSYFVTSW